MILTHIDKARIGRDIIGDGLLLAKSWPLTSRGKPFGRYSLPWFLKLPTSSFFLVSIEMCLPRFGRVREEKSGKLYRGGYHGQTTTKLYEGIQARGSAACRNQ